MSAPVQASATLQHGSVTEEGAGSQMGTREGAILPWDSETYMCKKWPHIALSQLWNQLMQAMSSFLLVPKCKHFKAHT